MGVRPAFHQFVTIAAPPAGPKRGWTVNSTVAMLAGAFGVPEGSYREYLGAFSAWAPKPKGSLHTCRNSRECQCGKFSSVLKAKRPGLHQESDHVPDPNLDLSFGDIDPEYRVPDRIVNASEKLCGLLVLLALIYNQLSLDSRRLATTLGFDIGS